MRLYELVEIERQKGDQKWAEMLNRIRVGEQTEEDDDALTARTLYALNIGPDHPSIADLPHVYPTNKQVSSHLVRKTLRITS